MSETDMRYNESGYGADDTEPLSTGGVTPMPPHLTTCSILDCSRPPLARGWCVMHYTRWLRHDDPCHSGPTLVERFWAKVEFTDTCWLWGGTRENNGYGRFSIGRRDLLAHRWAYEFCVGPIPEGLTLDAKQKCR